jgi:hypothetical protein
LIVMAKVNDVEHIKRLGINLIIKDLKGKKTIEELSENFRITNSCGELSKLDLTEFNETFEDFECNKYKYLKPVKPSEIVLD